MKVYLFNLSLKVSGLARKYDAAVGSGYARPCYQSVDRQKAGVLLPGQQSKTWLQKASVTLKIYCVPVLESSLCQCHVRVWTLGSASTV